MKRIVGALTAAAALTVLAANAQAAVVYEKGGNLYTASNYGKNPKLLAKGGREPGFTPDGKTVVYTNKNRAIFAIPAAGGTPVRLAGTSCSVCPATFSPDGKSLALKNSKGVLIRIPLDGGPAAELATGVATGGTFSPDSSQVVFDSSTPETGDLFTVPAAGGTPTKLPLAFGMTPLWTPAGIVTTTVAFGSNVQFQLVLLDASGNVKRVLLRRGEKAYEKNAAIFMAFEVVGSSILVAEWRERGASVLRLIGLNHGAIHAQQSFKYLSAVQDISADGKKILTVSKGKLQIVNFKTGKRTTVVRTGVKSGSIN